MNTGRGYLSESRLRDGITEAGIPHTDIQIGKLMRYAREIAVWNEKINLVGDPDIVGRHILDSLAGYARIRALGPASICDVGTGAGLPGIPLALVCEDVSFALNDKMGKRIGFLRNMLPVLGLSDRVTLLNMPVDEVDSKYDLLTVRAFKAFPGCLPQLFPLLNEGGSVVAYLGSDTLPEEYECVPLEYGFLKGKRHLGVISYREIERRLKGHTK